MRLKSDPEPQAGFGAGLCRFDRAKRSHAPRPSGRRPGVRKRGGVKPTMFKPLTYSVMHLCVAVLVAFALTRDWRIALGVGLIEPVVQTLAYIVHEKAWSFSAGERTGPGSSGL